MPLLPRSPSRDAARQFPHARENCAEKKWQTTVKDEEGKEVKRYNNDTKKEETLKQDHSRPALLVPPRPGGQPVPGAEDAHCYVHLDVREIDQIAPVQLDLLSKKMDEYSKQMAHKKKNAEAELKEMIRSQGKSGTKEQQPLRAKVQELSWVHGANDGQLQWFGGGRQQNDGLQLRHGFDSLPPLHAIACRVRGAQ